MTAKILRTPFTEEFLERSHNAEKQKDFDEGIIIIGDTEDEVKAAIDEIYQEGLDPISWFSEVVDHPGPGWRAVGNIKKRPQTDRVR